jgi:hypothetical protein
MRTCPVALLVLFLTVPALAVAQNNAPVVDAEPDQGLYSGDTIELLGSATDPDGDATEKSNLPLSGFYDHLDAGVEFGAGIGLLPRLSCSVDAQTQPVEYAGNMLVDCDGEVPHYETTIVVNPLDSDHVVGAYHTAQIHSRGAAPIARQAGAISVTFDGGNSWQEVVPPIRPYQSTGDPALAFDASGRLYFSTIAARHGPVPVSGEPSDAAFAYKNVSLVVRYSDDGGLSWTNPVTLSPGRGYFDSHGRSLFEDKEFIAADTGSASPWVNRVYVTWSSIRKFSTPGSLFLRMPIMAAHSDDGVTWSEGQEISGVSPDCSVPLPGGAPNACDWSGFSVPTVARNGKVYVGFENFNANWNNQYMVVSSIDGGSTWSAPVKVGRVNDRLPLSVEGRRTLTGCQFRVIGAGNIAVDPGDSSGDTVYAVWADNRDGTISRTNMDVRLARSIDGGATWVEHILDSSPNDQFYPWVAVALSGRVDVGYMDRSYSADQEVCQYGFTLSRVTFDAAGDPTVSRQRVDTGLSDAGRSRWYSDETDGKTVSIGDYNGVAIGPDGTTWSIWTDLRNVVADPPSPTQDHGQHAVAARTP